MRGLQVGTTYRVRIEDCCAEASFTSTLVAVTHDDGWSSDAAFENGVVFETIGSVDFTPVEPVDELDRQAAEIMDKDGQRTWRVRQTIEIKVTAPTVGDAYIMWRHELRRRVQADPLEGWGIMASDSLVIDEQLPFTETVTVTR